MNYNLHLEDCVNDSLYSSVKQLGKFNKNLHLHVDLHFSSIQFSRSVVSDSFADPRTAARQASLSITNSQSLVKLMSIELVMPSNHLILCVPFSSRLQSLLDTYRPGEFIFQCPIFLLFHTVHGVLKAGILKWFAIPFSSGPHFVRTLHHDMSVVDGPTRSWLIVSLS